MSWAEDEGYDGFDEGAIHEVRCKFCKEHWLYWEEVRGEHNRKKWVLLDEDGNIHDCRRPVKPSDFPLTT